MYTHSNRLHTHVKDPVFHVRVRRSVDTKKYQNNPACTESVSLQNAEVGHFTEEEDDVEEERYIMFYICSTLSHSYSSPFGAHLSFNTQ